MQSSVTGSMVNVPEKVSVGERSPHLHLSPLMASGRADPEDMSMRELVPLLICHVAPWVSERCP